MATFEGKVIWIKTMQIKSFNEWIKAKYELKVFTPSCSFHSLVLQGVIFQFQDIQKICPVIFTTLQPLSDQDSQTQNSVFNLKKKNAFYVFKSVGTVYCRVN